MPRAPRPAALALAAPLLSLLVACAGPRAHVRAPRVPMADGVELAVDVLLPADAPAAPRPTVLIQTRYWRSFELKGAARPARCPSAPASPSPRRCSPPATPWWWPMCAARARRTGSGPTRGPTPRWPTPAR